MFYYKIADMIIAVENPNLLSLEGLHQYISPPTIECNINISLRPLSDIRVPAGSIIADKEFIWLNKQPPEEGCFLIKKAPTSTGKVLVMVETNSQWSDFSIWYDQGMTKSGYKQLVENQVLLFIGVLFRNSLIVNGGIVMHASAINLRGKAVVFTAPSGTGKSTHTKLWQDYLGDSVTILNDDTPVIRFRGGRACVFGTPWSGSSGLHCNDNAPLGAIVVLEQADSNRLMPLSAAEAISACIPRFFLPFFNKEMMNRALTLVADIVSSVPVYLLRCRPEIDSVELMYQCLK